MIPPSAGQAAALGEVLTMQLNSITIMDLIAYGGAALGMVMACTRYKGGYVAAPRRRSFW